jgi:hypothetical protein
MINGREHVVAELDHLRRLLAGIRRRKFSEVILFQGDLPKHNFQALVNGDCAWLMYTHNIDQASFSSRDPSYSGPSDDDVDFKLSNGQVDQYPRSWTIATDQALKVIEHFFVHKALAPWVTWHDDFAKT